MSQDQPSIPLDTKPLDELIQKVKEAQKQYSQFNQEQVDQIFKRAAMAANAARIPLAKMVVEETGMGLVEDKIIKNHFAAEFIFHKYEHTQTCGVIEEDKANGIKKIAEPIGVLLGVTPTTNPTSTAIFKALISLKTRNGIIFAPHPKAKKSTIEAVRIILEAAVKAGALANIIGWVENPTIEATQYLMQHPDVNLILATGGPGMVKAAYSSGKPAIGVGPGNTPAVIDELADIRTAVSSILMSKTFDYGMICASEQSIVVVNQVYDTVKTELTSRGAHILSPEEKQKVAGVVLIEGKLNPAIVGQPAKKIADLAGINVADTTKVLIGEAEAIDHNEAFAIEKLSPVLGLYRAQDFEDAINKAVALIVLGGKGHTASLYTHDGMQDRIDQFAHRLPTGRILVNTPASHGGIGDIYNFKLEPSLTLGCGSWGGNSVSENVGVKHLLNIKNVAERRENMLWFKLPPKIYFKYGCLELAIKELAGKKKAFIVTDKPLHELGFTSKVTKVLDQIGVAHEVFSDVQPDPTLDDVLKGLERVNAFQPDVFIALGGGSPMDAAKIMWLMYENPDTEFEGLAMRFMDIRKKVYEFPQLGKKAYMVAIPTTSGTGSEVSPFAVVTDSKAGIKYPIADYELTPDMAIVDPELVLTMPPKLTAYGGLDALTHAIESYVSIFATEFTSNLSLQTIDMVFKYLPNSYLKGAEDVEAKEKMHYASTIAGMAFSNAFLGISHSLAHKLGSTFHVPHGLANALVLPQVIDYNKTDVPQKQATFPQYKYPQAMERYAQIADHIGIQAENNEQKVAKLIEKIQQLKDTLEIPKSIKEYGVDEKEFYEKVDLMSEQAFDDQCTGANPRYPLIPDLKELYIKAFEGRL